MYLYTYMSHHEPKWRASFWDGCTTNHLKSMMPSGASRGWAQLERGPFGLCCIDPPNPWKSGEISPSSWCKLRGCRILRQLYCLYCVFWSLCWVFFWLGHQQLWVQEQEPSCSAYFVSGKAPRARRELVNVVRMWWKPRWDSLWERFGHRTVYDVFQPMTWRSCSKREDLNRFEIWVRPQIG